MTAELIGPLDVGPAQIAVEILRRGNNVTVARVAIADSATKQKDAATTTQNAAIPHAMGSGATRRNSRISG